MNKYKNNNVGEQVYQYNAITGGLVAYYRSIEEAAMMIKSIPGLIKEACNGNIKEVNGFCFNYGLAANFKLNSDKRKKQVFQFSMKGEFLNTFDSVVDAAKETMVNKTSIAKCCRGEYSSAGNYKWEYKSENMKQNERDSISSK